LLAWRQTISTPLSWPPGRSAISSIGPIPTLRAIERRESSAAEGCGSETSSVEMSTPLSRLRIASAIGSWISII
jgi:hypothetical protein